MQPRIPRERIPWFPKIDFEACIGDQDCFKFCKNGVFAWDGMKNRPEIIEPLNCVVGCDACSQICPAEAIRFPYKEELRRILRALIEDTHQTALSAS